MAIKLLFLIAALAGAQPAFEVASVRSSAHPDDGLKGGPGGGRSMNVDASRFSATNANLLFLILRAYRITACRPMGEGDCLLVSGGPDWLQKDQFDVQAKIPDGSAACNGLEFWNGHCPQLELMLRALLADRFHLQAHRENRELPIYALTVSKKGHKLKPSASSEHRRILFRPTEANGEKTIRLEATNSSMHDLVDMYGKFMDRPVVDQTSLAGNFDFTMTYQSNPLAPGPFSELVGPDLFRAFQDQLGLKFEATKGPVEILVIDHAERPSAN